MYIPEVVQVIPHTNYTVDVYFSDGKITCYDMSDKLNKGVFTALQDQVFFVERCVILNDTLAWDVTGNMDCTQCIDIDPETLYEAQEITPNVVQVCLKKLLVIDA